MELLWFVPLILCVVRPAAVWLGLLGADCSFLQKGYLAWFGIRGIGSLYYLSYALEHGLPDGLGEQLSGLVLVTIVASIVAHGISVTPLMKIYTRRSSRRKDARGMLPP